MTLLTKQSLNVEQLRNQFYNATVCEIERITDSLMILRVRPDGGLLSFEAGQYTTLGLGTWEPRLAIVPSVNQTEGSVVTSETTGASGEPQLIRRPYSVTSQIFDDFGRVVRAGEGGILEFYIALVSESKKPAELTPRLFLLNEGDRLHVGRRCRGRYTLERVTNPDATVAFLSTGCGEAPNNAMIAELVARKHRGKIVSVVCTRRLSDLGYMGMHHLLERAMDNYRYLTLTTREPRNVDRKHPHYLGKRYIQDYFASEDLEEDAGVEFHPANTHVFLCGGPAMIGVPLHTHNEATRYPKPTGMIELLEKRGFKIDRADEPGNIHLEKYW